MLPRASIESLSHTAIEIVPVGKNTLTGASDSRCCARNSGVCARAGAEPHAAAAARHAAHRRARRVTNPPSRCIVQPPEQVLLLLVRRRQHLPERGIVGITRDRVLELG